MRMSLYYTVVNTAKKSQQWFRFHNHFEWWRHLRESCWCQHTCWYLWSACRRSRGTCQRMWRHCSKSLRRGVASEVHLGVSIISFFDVKKSQVDWQRHIYFILTHGKIAIEYIISIQHLWPGLQGHYVTLTRTHKIKSCIKIKINQLWNNISWWLCNTNSFLKNT